MRDSHHRPSPIADHNHGKISEHEAVSRIAGRYLGFASRY